MRDLISPHTTHNCYQTQETMSPPHTTHTTHICYHTQENMSPPHTTHTTHTTHITHHTHHTLHTSVIIHRKTCLLHTLHTPHTTHYTHYTHHTLHTLHTSHTTHYTLHTSVIRHTDNNMSSPNSPNHCAPHQQTTRSQGQTAAVSQHTTLSNHIIHSPSTTPQGCGGR